MDTISDYIPDRNLPDEWILSGQQIIADYTFALYNLVLDGAPPPGKDGRARIMKLLIRQVITQQLILGITQPKFMETVLLKASFLLNHNSQTSSKTIKTLLTYYHTARKKFERTINKGKKELFMCFKENNGEKITGCQIVTLEKEKGLPHNLIQAEMFKQGREFPKKEYYRSLSHWRTSLS
jgi:alanyl-tRNA synthetase